MTPEKLAAERESFSRELREAIMARNILTARTRQKVLNSLDELNDSKEDVRRHELREKAISEVISSEKMYIHQLELILKYFMKPLIEKEILRHDHFYTIFGTIESIFNINKELLNELETNTQNVANAFLKLAPYLKLYSVYACEFRKSLVLLQELQTKSKEFSKFLENQESRPEVQQKLSALLITPIQRVPRYRLLLKEILGFTSQTDPDYDFLRESLKEVETAAFHINSLVEEEENAQRLLELQRCLHNQKPSIVKPGRKLIKEGIVMKMAETGGHGCARYLIVLSDIILYCKMLKNKPTELNSLQCRCILPLHKCRITEIASKGVFTITCQNENLILYCEPTSTSVVQEWITTLQDAVRKCIDCRMTLRKASSSRKPVRKRHLRDYDETMIVATRQQLLQQRKRRYPLTKASLDNLSNIGLNEKKECSDEKRLKVTFNEQENQIYPEQRLPVIPEGQVQSNINMYGLQTRQNRKETVFSHIRGYFWGVGKSIKSIFTR